MSRPGRPDVAFLTWGRIDRAAEIAGALGGEAWSFRPRRLDRQALAPLRWLLGAVVTWAYLLRRRPRALVVTNPPIWLGLIAWMYTRPRRAPLVLDSHPGGFGVQGDPVAARVQRLHAWLAARADLVLVTAPHWVEIVNGWGGRGQVLHEAEPEWLPTPPKPAGEPFRLLFAGTFGRDEPVAEIVEAVRGLDNVTLEITGDPRKAPPEVTAAVGPNVVLLGWLDPQDYLAAISRADAVIVLSTEQTSVMRAACDVVWAMRPLLVNDNELLAEVFPDAVRAQCTVPELRAGVLRLVEEHQRLCELAPGARERQAAHWHDQLARLAQAVNRTST